MIKSNTKYFAFIATCLFFSLEAVSFGTTYYVSTGGSDSNSGQSTTAAWRTLGKANATLRAGDTVLLRAGTYNEVINPSNSGVAGAPITYRNYPGETVTVRGVSGQNAVVRLTQSWITVDGFTLKHIDPASVGRWDFGVWISGQSSQHNVIRNCAIVSQQQQSLNYGHSYGIIIQASDYTTIENCSTTGWPWFGACLDDSPRYTTVRNCSFVNNLVTGIYIASSYEQEGPMYILVENNLIDTCWEEDGIQFGPPSEDPASDDDNRGVIVRNNIIRYASENAIDLKCTAESLIEGNILYGCPVDDMGPGDGPNRGPGARAITHGSGNGSRDVIIRRNIIYDNGGGVTCESGYQVYHNTIIYNNRDYTGPNSSYVTTNKPAFTGLAGWNNRANVNIKNNIFGGHNSAEIAIAQTSPTLTIDGNLYFGKSGGAPLLVHWVGSSDWHVEAWSNWPSQLANPILALGDDVHGRSANPQFVNVPGDPAGVHTQYDFGLRSTSPAIDAGQFLTTTSGAGSGTTLYVKEARYFCDGYGITDGDQIQLQGQTATAHVVSVDRSTGKLVLDRSLSWTAGQGVSLAYQGAAPDIGAREYASGGTPTTYTLTTSATNGTITRAPNQTSYTAGQTVTLTATANSGYTFSGWSGDLTGTTNPASLVMDSNKSVTANFTASGSTGGTGSTTKTVGNTTVFSGSTTLNNRRAAPYTMPEAGQLQSLSIYHEAGSGQMLLGVYADSSGQPGSRLGVTDTTTVSSTAGWQTVALQSPVSVSAGQRIWLAWVFENNQGLRAIDGTPGRASSPATWSDGLPTTFGAATVADYIYSLYASYSPASTGTTSYTLTTSASNGTITRAPNQTSYTAGQTVTLTAAANTGYTFSGWSGDLTGTTNPATLVMDSNKSVTANFTANLYTLSISATNGSVTRSPSAASYTYGQVVTLQAVPDAGYVFTGWSGDASGTSSSTIVVMDANKTVTANFTAARYVLTVSGTHGVVTCSPSQASYTYGQVVTLQAVPDPNYVFTGWSGDASGTSASTTVTMNSDKTVVANFVGSVLDQKPPALTHCSPAPDAIQVPPNTLVVLHLSDGGAGVDAASVSIRVNGHLVQTGDADTCRTDYGVCRRLGTKADYTYVFESAGLFGYSRKVSVAVAARDLAGNTMPEGSYSFATEMYSFGLSKSVAPDQSRVEQGQPATVGDGQGNIWVVWQAGAAGQRHIYAARLAPDADAYGPAVQLSASTGDHCNPVLARDAAGTLYVVWQENPRGVWDICLTTSVDGATWSAPKRIVDPTLAANQVVDQVHPTVSAGRQSSNLVAVAWQDSRAGNQDIYVACSTNAFASATIARVTSDGADQTEPAVAIDGQDTVFVLWTDARTGVTSIYGAASNNGPWTNVAITAGPGNCSQPALAAGGSSPALHMVWVNDVGGDGDIFYASSSGLPVSPLAGTDIVDDTTAADQQAPALAIAAQPEGADHVFVCWQDGRNIAFSGDTDLYCVEVSPGGLATNVLVSDEGANSDQSDVGMALDGRGYPYLVWSDSAGKHEQIFSAGVTYMDATPLAAQEITAAAGGVVGTAPQSAVTLDAVSVVVPPQTCPYDATISIRRIRNPGAYATESLRLYDFGPSGLTFAQPVTITIPYDGRLTGKTKAYWFDAATNAFTSEGITNVQDITLASGLRALQFNATHFTPYAVSTDGRPRGKLPSRQKIVPAHR